MNIKSNWLRYTYLIIYTILSLTLIQQAITWVYGTQPVPYIGIPVLMILYAITILVFVFNILKMNRYFHTSLILLIIVAVSVSSFILYFNAFPVVKPATTPVKFVLIFGGIAVIASLISYLLLSIATFKAIREKFVKKFK